MIGDIQSYCSEMLTSMAAFTVLGYPVGQKEVIFTGMAVALVASLGYRWKSRAEGKRYTTTGDEGHRGY